MRTPQTHTTKMSSAILLLGPPGVGKTTTVTQLPGVYIIECDNNIDGPTQYAKRAGLSLDFMYDIPQLEDDGTTVPRAMRFKRVAALVNAAFKNDKVKTIVIDSLTTFVDFALDEVRRQVGRKIADGVTNFIDENLQIQDWGAFKTLIKHFIMTARASGKMIVFLGHVYTDKDDMTQALREFINCPGSMKEEIAAYFSECWFQSIEERRTGQGVTYVRQLRTVPRPGQSALGLKSAVGIGNTFDLDFKKLADLLSK